MPSNPPTLLSLNVGTARPLHIGGRSILSAIGKQATLGALAVGRLGVAGDEQADLSVHGGLSKAVYAYPSEHYAFWQAQRKERGVSLVDELLPPGFMGENLTLGGLLEHELWVGDRLHFPHCVLRVTEPRQPCFKFNAVMGYAQASKDMVLKGCSGFYLAVDEVGTVEAGQTFTVEPGRRALGMPEAFGAKRLKHLR